MTFSPSQNNTQNFQQRVESLRALLVREGLNKPSEYGPTSRLFGYERAIEEGTLTGVVSECAALGRSDLMPELLGHLTELELGRSGHGLLQKRLDDALTHVLPLLADYQLLPLLSACLTQRRDDVFDLFKPFLLPSMASSLLIMTAAANDAPKFGAYFIEHGDVLQALRDIKSQTVSNQVAAWWVEAIQEQRVPLPDLGRAQKHWRKKFPVLGSLMRNDELEKSLPEGFSVPRRPRF